MVTTSDSVRVRRDDAPKAFRRAPCTQQELISGSSVPMGQGWKEAALPQGSGWGKSWDPASEGVRFTHWHWWEQHWGGQGPASFHRVGPGQTRVRLGLDWRFKGRGTQHAGGCNRWTKVTWLVALCDSWVPASPIGPMGLGPRLCHSLEDSSPPRAPGLTSL